MNKLNNADKHREITVVTTISTTPLPNLVKPGSLIQHNSIYMGPGTAREERFDGDFVVFGEDHLYKDAMVRFGGDEILRGEDVVPFLNQASDAVCAALLELHSAYLTTHPPAGIAPPA